MPLIELREETIERLDRIAKITGKTTAEVIENALTSYGVTPARGLGLEAARMLLAAQGKDVMQIHRWIQDKVLTPSVVQRLGEAAIESGEDLWIPACGGHEVVCKNRLGEEYLYCWHPASGRHAYYMVRQDCFAQDPDTSAA